MNKIQKSLIKKVIDALRYQQREAPEAYAEFFINYGKILKEGIHFDRDNKESIAGIGLWYSHKQQKKITLEDYCKNIPAASIEENDTEESQADKESDKKDEKTPIYYLTGTQLHQLNSSPYLEKFTDSEHDVLLLTDPIDDWVVQGLKSYKDHPLQDAKFADISSNANTEERKEAEKEQQKINQDNKDFLALGKESIGTDKIDSIELVTTLKDSVAVLLPKEGAPSPQQERYMKAMGQNVPTSIQDLQLNASHPLVQKVLELHTKDADNKEIKTYL
jgi:molecular chaperone HtpG